MTVSEAVAAAAKRASEQLGFLKSVAEKVAAEKRNAQADTQQGLRPQTPTKETGR